MFPHVYPLATNGFDLITGKCLDLYNISVTCLDTIMPGDKIIFGVQKITLYR